MNKITKIDPKEIANFLLETGLLFQINWQILHPIGLNLSVIIDEETGEVSLDGLFKLSNEIGYEFSDDDFFKGLHKLKAFMLTEENVKRLYKRRSYLGTIVQNEENKLHPAELNKYQFWYNEYMTKQIKDDLIRRGLADEGRVEPKQAEDEDISGMMYIPPKKEGEDGTNPREDKQ